MQCKSKDILKLSSLFRKKEEEGKGNEEMN
jgi:hypothetical protein